MLKIYCLITGDDYELVKNETPESRKKISMYGMIIMLPVMLWLIQGFLIVSHVMNGSIWASAATSFIAGLTVFIIDRSIIMSGRGRWILFTRVLLGILMSVSGALIFDEVIFKNDIDKQLAENKRAYIRDEIINWTNANLQEIEIQNSVSLKADSLQNSALEIYLTEINGTGGTGRRGVDIVAKEKHKIYSEKKAVYESEKSKLDSMRSNIEKRRYEFVGNLESESDDGLLLHRIKAMIDLLSSNKVMFAFCIIFSFLFLIIELLVVIIKMSSEKTNYERMNEMKESIGASRINRLIEKDPQHFRTSSVHPGVIKLNEHLRKDSPKLF